MTHQEHELLLYLVFSADCTDAGLLTEWFGTPGQRAQLSDMYNPANQEAMRLAQKKLPDICLGCCTIFGHTLGGRLRTGCPACGQTQEVGGLMYEKLAAYRMYTQVHYKPPYSSGESVIVDFLHKKLGGRYYDGLT